MYRTLKPVTKFCTSKKTFSNFALLHACQSGRKPLTKIVATIGPKSEQLPMLTQVVDAGMKMMRINFSHATYDEANLRARNIVLIGNPNAKEGDNSSNVYPVMLDTQGPEIRTGKFGEGIKEVELKTGTEITFSIKPETRETQSPTKIWISYTKLLETVREGTSILLDDGAIEVKVKSIHADKGEVIGIVQNNGVLGNRKGVNIPGETVLLPAMCDKDMQDIKWGIDNDIDFIAASFVRKAKDVTDIRDYTRQLMMDKYGSSSNGLSMYPLPKIISKIESTEALKNFDAILDESDAIMVARGDLGVEIPIECLANVQKEIVRKCNAAGKPVVVATQMLESMQKNPRPTRAECTDVYNAVLDGADCVMLSGESAKGKYPVQSVAMMKRIVDQAEAWVQANPADSNVVQIKPRHLDSEHGIAYGIVEASKNLHATCIIVITTTGRLAEQVAYYRPNVPIVTLVPNAKLGRQLQIVRGIHPVITSVDLSSTSPLSSHERFDIAIDMAKSQGYCQSGDNVIIVATDRGTPKISNAGTMRVVTVL